MVLSTKKRAVVSLSGGMDSSSLLALLLASKEYQFVHCYAFDYGQRHSLELEKVKELVTFISRRYPVDIHIIDLKDVFSLSQSALGAQGVMEVPKEEYSEVNLRATVVENRNVIFSSIVYSKALSISKIYDCEIDIALGVHNSDEAVYPDCRPESTSMAKELFRISNYGSERIDYVTPFLYLTKAEVLTRGLASLKELNISPWDFYSRTSSCYDPQEEGACGVCATCRDRLSAFKENGIEDPIPYKEK